MSKKDVFRFREKVIGRMEVLTGLLALLVQKYKY
jgi:hypothetical protein